MSIAVEPIGLIHSSHKTKETAPIQGAFRPDSTGTIEVFAEYEEGLKDVEMFSHLVVIYHFDRAGDVELVRPTFLDDSPHGVFASRHPCRPNGIGMTVVRLIKRDGRRLEVASVDVLDGTPVIDIKPYVPRFDCFPDASEGWIADKENRPKPKGRE